MTSKMNTKELLKVLENDEINFIAQCGSVLQMNGVNVAINFLESEGIRVNGVVFLMTTNTLSGKDYERNFFIQKNNLKYITIEGGIRFSNNYEKIAMLWQVLFSSGKRNVVYYVCANLSYEIMYTILRSGKRAIYVEIEDGIGNYLDRHKEFMIIDFAGKKFPPYLWIYKYTRRVIWDVTYNVLYSLVKLKKDYLDAKLLLKHNMKRNEKIVNYYHHVLRRNGERLIYQDIKSIENSILIVGAGIESLDVLKELIDEIVSSNFKVIFKPHPREKDIEKYLDLGCILFQDESTSLETIFERLDIKPRYIIGTISTVLITGRVLFDIVTISYVNMMKKDEYWKRMSSLFFDTFKDIVLFPDSMNQLICMLN